VLSPPFFPGLAGIFIRARAVRFPFFFFALLFRYRNKKGSSFPLDYTVANTWKHTARPFHWGQLLWQRNSPSAFPGITRCGRSRFSSKASAFFHRPFTLAEGTVPKASTRSSSLTSSTRGCTNKSSIASSISSVSGSLARGISVRSERSFFKSVFYLSGSLVTVAWCKTSTDFVRETSDHDESTISTNDSLSRASIRSHVFSVGSRCCGFSWRR